MVLLTRLTRPDNNLCQTKTEDSIDNTDLMPLTENMYTSVSKNVSQYERPRILACKPVDVILVVLSLNQSNIATFVLQMGDVCLVHILNFNVIVVF